MDIAAPISAQGHLLDILLGGNLWAIIVAFFAGGLALAFTPCVLPMIPILSGILAGDDSPRPLRGFVLALTYVLGMAIVYTAAGVAAAALGVQLQATFNQPWAIVLFAGLFIVLALGMFGLVNLQLPAVLQGKLAMAPGDSGRGTVLAAFVMGGLSALVVTACVAPVLIAALTVIASHGDLLRGGIALFAMSLGMGAPLLLVGIAQGRLLPRAGAWMVNVKGAFGFMLLGVAIGLLFRILPSNVAMLLWGALSVFAGVFAGACTTLSPRAGTWQKLGKAFGVLIIFYGFVVIVGGLTGGRSPLQPLAGAAIPAPATIAHGLLLS